MVYSEIYKLNESNYYPISNLKTNIVIGSTDRINMKHYIGWVNRLNGLNKKTTPFTIDKKGVIHQHFNPNYYSDFFDDNKLNQNSIVILLENGGWLKKDVNNQYKSWDNTIYNNEDNVFYKKWREYEYWDKYTKEQFNSTLDLVNNLCEEFNISKTCVPKNNKIENVYEFYGVFYRSNLKLNYKDLNPSWDFDEFKEKIEL